MPAQPTGLAARAVAALLCAACVVGIVRIARQAPEVDTTQSSADGCAGRKRAEIEQRKAAGRLTAEQAMIQRQKIAKECP
jgi:hypothetical protein